MCGGVHLPGPDVRQQYIFEILVCFLQLLLGGRNRRTIRIAFGVAIAVWFFFVIFFDLLVLGGSLLFREKLANYFIFVSLFANPVGMVRVAGIIALNGSEAFGAAGAALMKFTGGILYGAVALVVGLIVWATLPLIAAVKLLKRQDI